MCVDAACWNGNAELRGWKIQKQQCKLTLFLVRHLKGIKGLKEVLQLTSVTIQNILIRAEHLDSPMVSVDEKFRSSVSNNKNGIYVFTFQHTT